MSRLKKSHGLAAACIACVAGFEGVRQTAYPDPATRGKPWTICFGETAGVHKGDHHSLAECKAMLATSLERYATGVEKCTARPLTDGAEAAFVSFAYNLGIGGYCRSSVRKLWDRGDRRGACDALLHFDRAAGIRFPGLTRRRQAERALCLKDGGLTP